MMQSSNYLGFVPQNWAAIIFLWEEAKQLGLSTIAGGSGWSPGWSWWDRLHIQPGGILARVKLWVCPKTADKPLDVGVHVERSWKIRVKGVNGSLTRHAWNFRWLHWSNLGFHTHIFRQAVNFSTFFPGLSIHFTIWTWWSHQFISISPNLCGSNPFVMMIAITILHPKNGHQCSPIGPWLFPGIFPLVGGFDHLD